MSGIVDAVIGIVVSLLIIAVGVIIVWALYPINPFIALVGVALLIILAIAVVVGFIRKNV
jgi:hypothetical protein